MTSLVSIVMPVYNGEQYLREAIDSVLAQTYPNWELVVVDDGSTDGSAAIVRSYEDRRIRYVYQENRGQAAALNHGLDVSGGEYVTTLDADDTMPVESIEKRALFLDEHPECGAVYADGVYTNADGQELLRFTEHMPASIDGDVYDTLIISPFYGTGASVLVRQAYRLKQAVRYDEEIVWCQDWDFYIRLAENTSFGFVDCLSIHYRLHNLGMTTVMPKGRRLESLIRLRNKVIGSQRFARTAVNQKEGFFYDFLVRDLDQKPEAQDAVFASDAFRACPKKMQGRLMRLAANEYLLHDRENAQTRSWLQRAWLVSPMDLKTTLVFFLDTIHPALARRVVRAYQASRQSSGSEDPFKLAQVVPGSGTKS